jgi:predicted 3-demethylubiquinone-9 3-methyltransferase (glyoxalase superfamily)
MITSIYPCLWYDEHALQAAEFYTQLFPDSRIKSDTGTVVSFELQGNKFIALNGGPIFEFNPSISLFVTEPDTSKIDFLWSKLTEGGQVMMPLGSYPWSAHYGWCSDRYGLNWQLFGGERDETKAGIEPILLFTGESNGKAAEALDFYCDIFQSDAPYSSFYEEGANQGLLQFGHFKANSLALNMMDGPGPHAFSFNESVSFVVECDDQATIDYYWNRLTEGGSESRCGWLKDRFGISWQIVPRVLSQLMSNPELRPKVVEAFLKMKKFIIADLPLS